MRGIIGPLNPGTDAATSGSRMARSQAGDVTRSESYRKIRRSDE